MLVTLAQAVRELAQAGKVPVIAEIKHVIPGFRGDRPGTSRGVAAIARGYERGGAVAISVVTERAHFGGAPQVDIPEVLGAVTLPVLIKDFISDVTSVDEYARIIGGYSRAAFKRCSLLLISHHIGRLALPRLLERVRYYGMQPLVEVRGIRDLGLLANLQEVELIGFNNKNIDVMETDDGGVKLNREFVREVRAQRVDALIVSASGHRNAADIRRSMAAGADAVLIGTSLLTAANPEALLARFTEPVRPPQDTV